MNSIIVVNIQCAEDYISILSDVLLLDVSLSCKNSVSDHNIVIAVSPWMSK